MLKNLDFKSALGKSVIEGVVLIVIAVVLAAASTVTKNPDLFSAQAVVVARVVVLFVNELLGIVSL